MDANNWRPNAPNGEPTMDTADWRTQLQPDSRQRIVNKIMETLRRHLSCSSDEGLNELGKIVIRFEEKIYTAATSQWDYLRIISLNMLLMDTADWRTELQPDSRQRIVNKIMETLRQHLSCSSDEGLNELGKIAIRFEEKIYTAATSQWDYLRIISLKMLSIETKSQETLPNPGSSSNLLI